MSRVFNLRNRDIVVAPDNSEDTKVNTSTSASERSEAEVEMAAIEVNEMLVQALTAMRPVIGELPSFSGASNALPPAPPAPRPQFKIGDRVEALEKGVWRKGVIAAISRCKGKVHIIPDEGMIWTPWFLMEEIRHMH